MRYLYKLICIHNGKEIDCMISEDYFFLKDFAEKYCKEGYRIEKFKKQEQ